MNNLKIGYASVNIDTDLKIGIDGYYLPRYNQGVLESLEVQTLALQAKDKTVLLVSVDTCMAYKEEVDLIASKIEEKTGIAKENIIISATHTHTAPVLQANLFKCDESLIKKYKDFLVEKSAECAQMAVNDLTDGKMGYGVVKAPDRIAYIRRYKMKDGSTMTCPPVNDSNIDYPLGELDQRVNVLRFDRNNKNSVVILNYGLHADTVNGDYIHSDWPGELRKTLDKALDGVKCITICGAQGDVGSTNVFPIPGDMNDTEISFDNEMKSPGMARFVGRALAGSVLQIYDKVKYIDVEEIISTRKILNIPTNRATEEELVTARKYKELYESGREDLIPFKAMELTTVVAEALRMCRFENGPDYIPCELTGLKLGEVALVGIPGEPFTEIGVKIKETEGYGLVMPCALTNGYNGYFPTKSAYAEGGYEARTSEYKVGVDDCIITCAKEILNELK